MRYVILSLVAAVLVFSCGPYKVEKNPSPLQETEKITLLDHALTRYLKLVKSKATRLENGRLEVKAAMENEENNDVWADVQVIFRDGDGFELGKSGWQPVQFHRRAVTTFSRTSLNEKAADYRILVRNIK